MKKKRCGVYFIICKANNHFYIGSFINIELRIKRHIRELKNNIHYNKDLQDSFNKYGLNNFIYKFIFIDDRDLAYNIEDFLLQNNKFNKNMMNVSVNSKFGDILTHNSNRNKIIKKIKATINNNINSMTKEERKEKFGLPGKKNGMYGKHHTKKAKKKISKKNKGNSYAKGRKMSDAQKAYLSKLASQRTGNKNPFYGKHHTEETKKKISEKNKGKIPVNARKVKVKGKIYNSICGCSRDTGIHPTTIIYRIRSKYFKDYKYLDK